MKYAGIMLRKKIFPPKPIFSVPAAPHHHGNQEPPMNSISSARSEPDPIHCPNPPDAQKGIPIPREAWERQYRNGEWDYLECDDEAAHYQAITRFYASHGKNRSVLDVGCGTGILYQYLKTSAGMHPSRYVGIDLSEAAVRQAAQRYPEADFRQLDYSSSSIDMKFACLIFNETLYFFENPMAILNKSVRENMDRDSLFIISMYGDHHEGIWNNVAMHYTVLDEMEVENERQVRWKIQALRPLL
jgi:SAM-dependent methyltransferase